MLSVASLLNPVNSDFRSTVAASSPSTTYSIPPSPYHSPSLSQALLHNQKMENNGALVVEGGSKDTVRFPAHEDVDEDSLREMEKYRISQFGRIKDSSRHIPYNSDKKSFLEKTGRESFEVFYYEYQLVGNDKKFTVMWDYNIGLVRVTPFFKSLGYSKTTPARMLSLNPGLRDITHSITGGALVAQGYWMPYSCALAVCATFCADISGALIPIFGQDFPSKCKPNPNDDYRLMVIDQNIIVSAAAEAEFYRQKYATPSPSSNILRLDTPSPKEHFQDAESYGPLRHRLRLKRAFTNISMCSTEAEMSDTSRSSVDRYVSSPPTPSSTYTSSGWVADNEPPKHGPVRTPLPSYVATQASRCRRSHRTTVSLNHPSPWLSVIPRSVADTDGSDTIRASSTINSLSTARILHRETSHAEPVEVDVDYDAEESASDMDRCAAHNNTTVREYTKLENQAALALMQLRNTRTDWDVNTSRVQDVDTDAGSSSSTLIATNVDLSDATDTPMPNIVTTTNNIAASSSANSGSQANTGTGTAHHVHTGAVPYFEHLHVVSPNGRRAKRHRRAASL